MTFYIGFGAFALMTTPRQCRGLTGIELSSVPHRHVSIFSQGERAQSYGPKMLCVARKISHTHLQTSSHIRLATYEEREQLNN